MTTHHPKNIRVGQVELVYCGTDENPMWAIHGGRYETRERIARELAKRINDQLSGKLRREKHI